MDALSIKLLALVLFAGLFLSGEILSQVPLDLFILQNDN